MQLLKLTGKELMILYRYIINGSLRSRIGSRICMRIVIVVLVTMNTTIVDSDKLRRECLDAFPIRSRIGSRTCMCIVIVVLVTMNTTFVAQ